MSRATPGMIISWPLITSIRCLFCQCLLSLAIGSVSKSFSPLTSVQPFALYVTRTKNSPKTTPTTQAKSNIHSLFIKVIRCLFCLCLLFLGLVQIVSSFDICSVVRTLLNANEKLTKNNTYYPGQIKHLPPFNYPGRYSRDFFGWSVSPGSPYPVCERLFMRGFRFRSSLTKWPLVPRVGSPSSKPISDWKMIFSTPVFRPGIGRN